MNFKTFFEQKKNADNKIIAPYVIAEAGVNHEGQMELARRLIDEAAEGGADAIKFQTYRAGTIASKDSPAYWDRTKEPTDSQYKLFCKYDKFWKNEFVQLKECCDKAGIEFMSTPFDIESCRFLNDLMNVFKISSSDITNKPFIKFICDFQKPIILSTGASYLWEIEEAVSWIEEYKVPLTLMHCVLNYPTPDENANLGMISHLISKFPDYFIGYSDHTLPQNMKTLEIAHTLGACILEKHFTHDKTLPGNDHYHAMDKEDLKLFLHNIKQNLTLMGQFKITALADEELARQHARRSLVAKRSISASHIIAYDDLTWKRPAHGISPREIDSLIGKVAKVDIEEDTVLKWNFFD